MKTTPQGSPTVGARTRFFAAEVLLLIPLPFVLKAFGVISNASLPLLIIGAVSLWLRRDQWRSVGLRRPASWRNTILLGIGIGVAYGAVDIFAILPTLRMLTGEALQSGLFAEPRGSLRGMLSAVALSWAFAAFGEELAYRGYAFNRVTELFGPGPLTVLTSAMIVSALFGYAHVADGFTGVLANVIAGLMFTGVYVWSGRNLWLPIIAHGVSDTSSLALLYFGFQPG